MNSIRNIVALIAVALAGSAFAERPTYRNFESKLESLSSSKFLKDRWSGSLGGITTFGERFFVSGSVGLGSDSAFGSTSVGLGTMKDIGTSSSLFAAIGARRYNEANFSLAAATTNLNNEITTATATVGFRSMVTDRMELQTGVTKLARGIYSLQIGAKGTYYFSDSFGAVLELGSSDGDGSGGIGLQYRF